MLGAFPLDVNLLATDLDRAKAFYGDTLGLEIVMENADGVTFRCGGGSRLVVTKSTTGTADVQTQATWRVDDVAAEVADLESRGIKTDTFGMPGPADGVADIGFALAAWFEDPFKNSLGIIELKRTRATGRIEVSSYEPTAYDEPPEGPELVEIRVRETFAGDIQGEGVARFLQAVRPDGSASFVGIERVDGTIGGRRGTFLLQDRGTLEGGTVSGEWFVIEGSGTGELTGLRGEGRFTAELGQGASITLDHWFD